MLERSPKRLVRRLLQRLLRPSPGYRYQAGDTVVEDFAEFSNIPLQTVIQRIADFERINALDWNAMEKSEFSERAAQFYNQSQNFIFGILSANPRPAAVVEKLERFNPRIMQAIRAHPGKRFLEFGGGVGVFCELVARIGKEVHYLEVAGLTSRFALWRFRKLGLTVTFIEAQPERICVPGQYDIVYTDAVIEHLPPPLQMEATRALAAAVGPGGLLVFLVDLSGPTPEDPMHHVVDIHALHSALAASGLSCQDGLDRFCSIWRRPE